MTGFHDAHSSRWTLPNLLTGFRFVAAPFLLLFAWNGYAVAFMVLLAVAFLTDVLDGWAARITGQVSDFGAVLDSWADVITYLTIALCCWWLWPDIVAREWLYVALIVASCLLPSAAGLLKFGRFTSYHTWGVKLAAASMGGSLYLLFLGGPVLPFRVAAVFCILAAFEEIVITVLSKSPRSDVRSLWHVVRNVEDER